ncbi:unnamed protein product [Nezara viridula]|uniref:DDE Tnp4 domain-containing protein n=1 Tax=Nezara viridula TaxID=85310 RepID=A0A9P0MML9_NEZVI|nr:unnamed protein product [Nezara viridula]
MHECRRANSYIIEVLGYSAYICFSGALRLPRSRVGRIVSETTYVIWTVLKDICIPLPTMELWKRIAERFHAVWNIPNYIGAIDSRHIRIKKLPNFNYKSFHSLILLGCCDAGFFFYHD